MLKLIITLTTLVHILIAQNANDIYTNALNSQVINYQGKQLLAFTLDDAKVLQARDIMLWEYESQIDIISKNINTEKKKSKIYKYIAVGGIVYIILDIVINTLKD